MVKGGMCMVKGGMHGEGGMCGKGGHAWWGACVVRGCVTGGMCGKGGHAWWGHVL